MDRYLADSSSYSLANSIPLGHSPPGSLASATQTEPLVSWLMLGTLTCNTPHLTEQYDQYRPNTGGKKAKDPGEDSGQGTVG